MEKTGGEEAGRCERPLEGGAAEIRGGNTSRGPANGRKGARGARTTEHRSYLEPFLILFFLKVPRCGAIPGAARILQPSDSQKFMAVMSGKPLINLISDVPHPPLAPMLFDIQSQEARSCESRNRIQLSGLWRLGWPYPMLHEPGGIRSSRQEGALRSGDGTRKP